MTTYSISRGGYVTGSGGKVYATRTAAPAPTGGGGAYYPQSVMQPQQQQQLQPENILMQAARERGLIPRTPNVLERALRGQSGVTTVGFGGASVFTGDAPLAGPSSEVSVTQHGGGLGTAYGGTLTSYRIKVIDKNTGKVRTMGLGDFELEDQRAIKSMAQAGGHVEYNPRTRQYTAVTPQKQPRTTQRRVTTPQGRVTMAQLSAARAQRSTITTPYGRQSIFYSSDKYPTIPKASGYNVGSIFAPLRPAGEVAVQFMYGALEAPLILPFAMFSLGESIVKEGPVSAGKKAVAGTVATAVTRPAYFFGGLLTTSLLFGGGVKVVSKVRAVKPTPTITASRSLTGITKGSKVSELGLTISGGRTMFKGMTEFLGIKKAPLIPTRGKAQIVSMTLKPPIFKKAPIMPVESAMLIVGEVQARVPRAKLSPLRVLGPQKTVKRPVSAIIESGKPTLNIEGWDLRGFWYEAQAGKQRSVGLGGAMSKEVYPRISASSTRSVFAGTQKQAGAGVGQHLTFDLRDFIGTKAKPTKTAPKPKVLQLGFGSRGVSLSRAGMATLQKQKLYVKPATQARAARAEGGLVGAVFEQAAQKLAQQHAPRQITFPSLGEIAGAGGKGAAIMAPMKSKPPVSRQAAATWHASFLKDYFMESGLYLPPSKKGRPLPPSIKWADVLSRTGTDEAAGWRPPRDVAAGWTAPKGVRTTLKRPRGTAQTPQLGVSRGTISRARGGGLTLFGVDQVVKQQRAALAPGLRPQQLIMPGQTVMPRVGTPLKPGLIIIPNLRELVGLRQPTRTTRITATPGAPPFVPVVVPPAAPPLGPPAWLPIVPFGGGVKPRKRRGAKRRRARRRQYRPSLIALMYGVTAKKKPATTTGIGIRPIIGIGLPSLHDMFARRKRAHYFR